MPVTLAQQPTTTMLRAPQQPAPKKTTSQTQPAQIGTSVLGYAAHPGANPLNDMSAVDPVRIGGRIARKCQICAATLAPRRRRYRAARCGVERHVSTFIATEVFEDRAALERHESLPEVAAVLGVLEESLAAEPEATIFNVSSSEPWGD